MKTQFYLRIVTVLLLVMSAGSAFAQRTGKAKSSPQVRPNANSIAMKKASVAFERDFKGATAIKWTEVDNNFHVNFTMNRQKNAILYGRGGNIIYHIIFGFGSNLSKNVADEVNSQYPNSKIERVFHVFQGPAEVWFVNLEEEKSLIQARVEDGLLLEDYRITNQNSL